jgi:hypothetical protein
MRCDRRRGSCLCDRCCERARTGSPQYEQQYGLFGIGYPGNGLGQLGRGQDPKPLELRGHHFYELPGRTHR